MVDGIIKYKVDYDTESAKKSVNTLNQSVKNVGTNLSNVGAKMTMGLTLPLATIAVSSIKMASDYTENLNKVNTAFGDTSKSVIEFSKTSLKNFGIANVTALGMASLFGDMGTAMGQTTQEAATMSIELTGLAGDLKSYKNISLERAQTALAGIYTGETEALKGLGYVMNDQIIKSYLVSKGIKKEWQEMTQAEKVATRYSFIMEVTAAAQDDYKDTSESVANKTGTLKEKIKELQVEMGTKLEPVTYRTLDAANFLLEGFNDLDEHTQDLIISVGLLAIAIGPASALVGNAMKLGAILGSPFAVMTAGIVGSMNAIFKLGFRFEDLIENYDYWTDETKTMKEKIVGFADFVATTANKAIDKIGIGDEFKAPLGNQSVLGALVDGTPIDWSINKQNKKPAPKVIQDPKNKIIIPQQNQSSAAITTTNNNTGFGPVTINVQSMDSNTDITKNVNTFMNQVTKKLEYGGVFKK